MSVCRVVSWGLTFAGNKSALQVAVEGQRPALPLKRCDLCR